MTRVELPIEDKLRQLPDLGELEGAEGLLIAENRMTPRLKSIIELRKRELKQALVVLACLLAMPADAQDLPSVAYQPDPFVPEPRGTLYADAPAHDEWFARIEVHNRTGTYNEVETHPTVHGDVQMEYLTTPPSAVNDPNSADSACIVALPDGVVAYPMCLTIMEQTTDNIFLYRYLGG